MNDDSCPEPAGDRGPPASISSRRLTSFADEVPPKLVRLSAFRDPGNRTTLEPLRGTPLSWQGKL